MGGESAMSIPASMINLASMPGKMLTGITKCFLGWRLGELKSFQILGVKKLCSVAFRWEDHLTNELAPVSTLNNWIVAAYCIQATGPETQYLDKENNTSKGIQKNAEDIQNIQNKCLLLK